MKTKMKKYQTGSEVKSGPALKPTGAKVGVGAALATGLGMAAKGIADKVKVRKAKKKAEKEAEASSTAKKMKTGGMVNPNAKVNKQTVPGSKGVRSGVNPKAVNQTIPKSKGSGKANTPPSKAIPAAKYGRMMKKGGTVMGKKC